MPATFQYMQEVQKACSHCSLQHLCLPYGLNSADTARLEILVDVGRPFVRGSTIFAQGDPLTAIYAVVRGSAKTAMVDADGLEQIMGFYYPGDLIGLDGMATKTHQCSASALEHTALCRIPFDQLDDLLGELSGLRRQVMRLMSQTISNDEQLLLTLGRKNSEARIATLVLSLSRRCEQRGMSASPIHLSMARADLANFLGMRVETVSRILRRLQEQRIIRVERTAVHILDEKALKSASGRGAWAVDQ